jgi:hypothetical protein
MADFLILPRIVDTAHDLIRSGNIDNRYNENTNFKGYVTSDNLHPKINWFSGEDWGLRLLGEGTLNGCNHYLILGRPGGDYSKQIELKMSVEVDLDIAVSFLNSHPNVSSVVFGTILLGNVQGPISNMDILDGCSWMSRLDNKLVECSDTSIQYENTSFEIMEYLVMTPFGNNGSYLITVNDTLLKFNPEVFGTCPKTGSRFFTFPKTSDTHKMFLKQPIFSDNCSTLPNDVFPTHAVVEGDSFSVEVYDTLLEKVGISTGPALDVISNIPYTKQEDKYVFDFTNKNIGVINFSFNLSKSKVIKTLNKSCFPDQIVTIIRK